MPKKSKGPENWKPHGSGGPPSNGREASKALSTALINLPITEERKAKFLHYLAETGHVSTAAQCTDGRNDTRRSYIALTVRDPDFKRRYEDALQSYGGKVLAVLREELFVGQRVPVLNRQGGIVRDPDTGKPIFINKRDARIVLAAARIHEAGLREHKTVTINNEGQPVNPHNPEIRILHSDIQLLPFKDRAGFIECLRTIDAHHKREAAPYRTGEDHDSDIIDITPTPTADAIPHIEEDDADDSGDWDTSDL